MRNRANPTVFALILVLTALAVVIVWPSNPDRYLPRLHPLAQRPRPHNRRV